VTLRPCPATLATLRALGFLDVAVPNESRSDLDSHADQCAVGNNCLAVHDYDRPINVSGYDPSGPIAKGLKTVSAALAYDDPPTWETVILLVHQIILIPDLPHNLRPTMQVRLDDVMIRETPRFLTENVTDFTHTIVIPTEDADAPYVIPLSLQGVTSTFPTRRPTVEENETLPHLTLASEDPPYDPCDPSFAADESALTRHLSETGDRIGGTPPSRRLCSVSNMASIANDVRIGLDGPTLSLQMTSPKLEIQSFSRSISALKPSPAGCREAV
jgi:hypothetical protein